MKEITIKPGNGPHRDREWNGNIYRIRDVWCANAESPLGIKHVHCEFATTNSSGRTVWTPCVEGVMFDDIAPYKAA